VRHTVLLLALAAIFATVVVVGSPAPAMAGKWETAREDLNGMLGKVALGTNRGWRWDR
jgi:hypothetical protein